VTALGILVQSFIVVFGGWQVRQSWRINHIVIQPVSSPPQNKNKNIETKNKKS
jgi:hypothetical protein